jgi:hypothetical protein
MYVKSHPIKILNSLKCISANDLIRNGARIIPAVFFVHAYHTEVNPIEEHKIKPGEPFLDKWQEWLDDKRIYIKEEKKEYKI